MKSAAAQFRRATSVLVSLNSVPEPLARTPGNHTASTLVAIEQIADAPRLVDVHWIITRRCSYACPYCPPHRHDPKAPQVDAAALVGGLERLRDLLTGEHFRLNLTGGEPTVHPGFLRFVEAACLCPQVATVRVVTNLASPDRLYVRLAEIAAARPGAVRVVASLHNEEAEPTAFIRRIRLLIAARVPTLVKVMVDGPRVSRSVIDELGALLPTNAHLSMATQVVRGVVASPNKDLFHLSSPSDPSDLRRIIRTGACGECEAIDEVSGLIERGENHFHGWECDAGSRALLIESDGRVYSALCKPDTGPLLNLYDPATQFRRPTSVLCPHVTCECSSTVRIPKRRLHTGEHH